MLAMPWFNHFGAERLKADWRAQGLYPELSRVLQEQIETSVRAGDPAGQALALIKDEITPSYVQEKVETVTDDTAAWATGQTNQAPGVSFNDLKQKIQDNNPEIKGQLDELLEQAAANRSQVAELSQLSDEPAAQQLLEQIATSDSTLDRLMTGNWTASLEKPLSGLPLVITIYRIALPVLTVLLGLSLIGVVLLSPSLKSRLRYTGWLLVIAAAWNGLVGVVFATIMLSDMLLGFIPDIGLWRTMVVMGVRSLQETLFGGYWLTASSISLGLLVVGVGLVVAERVMRRRQGNENTTNDKSASWQGGKLGVGVQPEAAGDRGKEHGVRERIDE